MLNGFEFSDRDAEDILQDCGCDHCRKRTILSAINEKLRERLARAPTIYGVVTDNAPPHYHGWDGHQGEYDTHVGKLVSVSRIHMRAGEKHEIVTTSNSGSAGTECNGGQNENGNASSTGSARGVDVPS